MSQESEFLRGAELPPTALEPHKAHLGGKDHKETKACTREPHFLCDPRQAPQPLWALVSHLLAGVKRGRPGAARGALRPEAAVPRLPLFPGPNPILLIVETLSRFYE